MQWYFVGGTSLPLQFAAQTPSRNVSAEAGDSGSADAAAYEKPLVDAENADVSNMAKPWQPAQDGFVAGSVVADEEVVEDDVSLRFAATLLRDQPEISLNALMTPASGTPSQSVWSRSYAGQGPLEGLSKLLAAMADFHSGEGIGPASQIAHPMTDEALQLAPSV